ncbi:IS66 family transposase [Plebeiibacterium marinum]|uniref:IS66 family transposase n=1 Tax=Plebeiibacterium marinum TaxID=2992111 RepID=A0AAE3SK11_9BACT|nr:IS66 family transposase [Plebeiobacterium marinum]MCW3806079.1 IS66 family transposase [Plebeiobacterium marinum]
MTNEEEAFLQQLLLERDEFYRETSRLKGQIADLKNFAEEKSSFQQQIGEKDQLIHKLQQQIQWLQRKVWGKSSEKYIKEDPLQRKLDFDGVDLLPEEKDLATTAKEEIEQYKLKRVVVKEKKHPVRKPLPEGLPREECHIYPEHIDYKNCVELAPEITEILEKNPARYYVRRIIRHKYVLKADTGNEQNTVVTAPMPALPIAKSYAGSSILADLIINKYVYHLPLYRQLQMLKQEGLFIPASTVNDWIPGVADLMRPAYYRLMELILKSGYVQSDETTIPIVNDEKHKTVKGYIWMLRAVIPKLVLFYYDQGSRAQKVALHLFKDYQGVIQTDGYAVYDIYENKKGVLPIGCWAHARRKFEEALKEDKARASYALEQIGLLYDVERQADQENLSDEQRADLRTRLAYPIMVAFEKWLVQECPKVLPKGRIGKAIGYTYNIYHKLTRYHLDGRYKLDNNLAENAIRPIALGRKNWLFCGNHEAAENAAIIYSMLGCCKACDINFRDWLIYFLNNVHDYDNDYTKDLAELLPHNFKPNADKAN